MGYKIQYGPVTKIERKYVGHSRKFIGITLCVIIVGALFLFGYNTGCFDAARDVLLPGDPEITASALADMTENIKHGQSIKEAFTAFCMEIIDNAEMS